MFKLITFNSKNMAEIVIITLFFCTTIHLWWRTASGAQLQTSHIDSVQLSNTLLDGLQCEECENQSNKFRPFNFTEPNLIWWAAEMDSQSLHWSIHQSTSAWDSAVGFVSGRQSWPLIGIDLYLHDEETLTSIAPHFLRLHCSAIPATEAQQQPQPFFMFFIWWRKIIGSVQYFGSIKICPPSRDANSAPPLPPLAAVSTSSRRFNVMSIEMWIDQSIKETWKE